MHNDIETGKLLSEKYGPKWFIIKISFISLSTTIDFNDILKTRPTLKYWLIVSSFQLLFSSCEFIICTGQTIYLLNQIKKGRDVVKC